MSKKIDVFIDIFNVYKFGIGVYPLIGNGNRVLFRDRLKECLIKNEYERLSIPLTNKIFPIDISPYLLSGGDTVSLIPITYNDTYNDFKIKYVYQNQEIDIKLEGIIS